MVILFLCIVMQLKVAENQVTVTENIDTSIKTSNSFDRPAPPTDLSAKDKANDAGNNITLEWHLSADDNAGKRSVIEYSIERAILGSDSFALIGTANKGVEQFVDATVFNGVEYVYRVFASDGQSPSIPAISNATAARAQWFHTGRTSMLIAVILLSFFVLWFISQAKRGKEIYIRTIAGLEAVEEAVGRATEMGRPIMYIPGILDMDDIQTIASIIILGKVARKAAQYETPILVPCTRSLVMSAAQETVKEACVDAGRPDFYDPAKINYLTDDQFGYAAGVDGLMIREKPGAIFYMGAFYAESLILAETGHSTGAIQIAGTAMPSQLPFFVTACDYTLIGEELFAASAYLSKEPLLLGSLKGQDWGKAVILLILTIGVLLASLGFNQLAAWLAVS